jgi:hypothetical protein
MNYKQALDIWKKIDPINRMNLLTVIPLSGFHCIIIHSNVCVCICTHVCMARKQKISERKIALWASRVTETVEINTSKKEQEV